MKTKEELQKEEELKKALELKPTKTVRINLTTEDQYLNMPSKLRNLGDQEEGGDEPI